MIDDITTFFALYALLLAAVCATAWVYAGWAFERHTKRNDIAPTSAGEEA